MSTFLSHDWFRLSNRASQDRSARSNVPQSRSKRNMKYQEPLRGSTEADARILLQLEIVDCRPNNFGIKSGIIGIAGILRHHIMALHAHIGMSACCSRRPAGALDTVS